MKAQFPRIDDYKYVENVIVVKRKVEREIEMREWVIFSERVWREKINAFGAAKRRASAPM